MCAQLPSSPNPARPSHHLLCVTLSALSILLGCISTDLPFQRFSFCAVLRHAVLYCTVLHHTTLNCTQLHSTIKSYRTICTALGGCSRQRCRERHRKGPQHSWQASEDAGETYSLRCTRTPLFSFHHLSFLCHLSSLLTSSCGSMIRFVCYPPSFSSISFWCIVS